MAWSYTKARGQTGWRDPPYELVWINDWKAEEVPGAPDGYIGIRVTFHTESYQMYGGVYTSSFEDCVSFGNEKVVIQPYEPDYLHQNYDKTVYVPESWNGETVTFRVAWGSYSTTLDAIPTATASPSASDGTFGNPVLISLSGSATGSTYTPSYVLTVTCAGLTETITDGGTAAQYEWTPDLEIYAEALTNAASASAVIRCETWYGSNYAGAESATITIRFAGNSLPPTLNSGWMSAAPLNTGLPNTFSGVYIEGISKARISFDRSKVSCLHSASVSSFSISCNGVTRSGTPDAQTGLLTLDTDFLPGTAAEIECTVTDSRGQTNSDKVNVTLQSYRAPTLSGISLFRSDQLGTASENGTYFAVTATAGFSSIKDGNDTELNGITLALTSRDLNGTTGPSASLTSGVQSVVGGFSPDTAYVLTLTATDLVGNTEVRTARFPTRAWVMKFRPDGDGVAFGHAPSADKRMELGTGWSLVLYDELGTNSAELDYYSLIRQRSNIVTEHNDFLGPIMSVAESYLHAGYDSDSRLTYSSQHGLFSTSVQVGGINAIVCSQFVEACLYGIYFSQSRYVQSENERSIWGFVAEQYGGYQTSSDTTRQSNDKAYFTRSGDVYTKYTGELESGVTYYEYENPIFAEDCIDDYMTARRLARYCDHFGWLKEYDSETETVGLEPVRSDIRSKKIRPGDILFYANANASRTISNVTHCAICVAAYKTYYITIESAGPEARLIDGAGTGVFFNTRLYASDASGFRPIAYYARIPLQSAMYKSVLADSLPGPFTGTVMASSTSAVVQSIPYQPELPAGIYTVIARHTGDFKTFYVRTIYDDGTTEQFSESVSYPTGYHVVYDNIIYRFTKAHEAGPWIGDSGQNKDVVALVGKYECESFGDYDYIVFYAEMPIQRIQYRLWKGVTEQSASFSVRDIRLYKGFRPFDA